MPHLYFYILYMHLYNIAKLYYIFMYVNLCVLDRWLLPLIRTLGVELFDIDRKHSPFSGFYTNLDYKFKILIFKFALKGLVNQNK